MNESLKFPFISDGHSKIFRCTGIGVRRPGFYPWLFYELTGTLVVGIPSLSLSFSICTMRKLGQIVSVGSPGPTTLPSCKNMGFGAKSSGRNNFSLLDVWPLAPQGSSLSPFPHLWNKDFWSRPTRISIKSRHICLVTCVDRNSENLEARNIYKESNSSVQTHTHTQPGRGHQAFPFRPATPWFLMRTSSAQGGH